MNKNTTAFPASPVQDNFGKVFTPFPGFTKYEYVLLQFSLKGDFGDWPDHMSAEDIAMAIMQGAKVMADAYFSALEQPEEKPQPFTIIQ